MPQIFKELIFKTSNKVFLDITNEIIDVISYNSVNNALVNLSIMHTSCSLLIQENADPSVQKDIKDFLNTIAPEKEYLHKSEGPDDMPAHLKSLLTQTHLSLSVKNKKLILGKWQGIFLIEHRVAPHKRRVLVHILEV